MMKGSLGLIVVCVSLLGTAAFGATIAAMTPEEVAGIEYQYLTNLDGLYTSENVPIYTDYNPASNWNGYRYGNLDYTSGVSYTTLTRYNGIPVIQEDGLTDHEINLTALGLSNEIPPASAAGTTTWYIDYGGVRVDNPNIASIYRLYTAIEPQLTEPEADFIRFDCSGIWGCYDYGWGYPTTSPSIRSYEKASAAYMDYTPATDLCKVYNSAGTMLYAGSGKGISAALAWGGTGDPLATAMTVYEVTLTTPTYIDIRNGMELSISPGVYWNNGYNLDQVQILVKPDDDNITFTVKTHSESGAVLGSVRVSVEVVNGSVEVSYIRYNPAGGIVRSISEDLGKWDAVLLTFDGSAGTMTATGVYSFYDFLTYKISDRIWSVDTGMTGYFMDSGGGTVGITGSFDAKFGIVNTRVFLDNYSLIYSNPSITITDYFPENNLYRITFDSFATFGDSVTINGQTYSMEGNKIEAVWTVDGATDTGLVPISGLTVETTQTNTVIKWSNGKTLSEPTSSDTITFGGAWFFDSDYYVGKNVTNVEYSWEPLSWGLDKSEAILISLGIAAIAAFVASRLKNLGWVDYAVILVFLAAGWVML